MYALRLSVAVAQDHDLIGRGIDASLDRKMQEQNGRAFDAAAFRCMNLLTHIFPRLM